MMEVRGNLAKTKTYKQEKKRKKIVNLSNLMKNKDRARENQQSITYTSPRGMEIFSICTCYKLCNMYILGQNLITWYIGILNIPLILWTQDNQNNVNEK